MYICIYVHTRAYVYVHVQVYVYMYVYMFMYVYMYMCICLYIHMYTHVYMYAYMYMSMHMYMYMCTLMYIYLTYNCGTSGSESLQDASSRESTCMTNYQGLYDALNFSKSGNFPLLIVVMVMKHVHISGRRSTARQHRLGCYVRGFA